MPHNRKINIKYKKLCFGDVGWYVYRLQIATNVVCVKVLVKIRRLLIQKMEVTQAVSGVTLRGDFGAEAVAMFFLDVTVAPFLLRQTTWEATWST